MSKIFYFLYLLNISFFSGSINIYFENPAGFAFVTLTASNQWTSSDFRALRCRWLFAPAGVGFLVVPPHAQASPLQYSDMSIPVKTWARVESEKCQFCCRFIIHFEYPPRAENSSWRINVLLIVVFMSRYNFWPVCFIFLVHHVNFCVPITNIIMPAQPRTYTSPRRQRTQQLTKKVTIGHTTQGFYRCAFPSSVLFCKDL